MMAFLTYNVKCQKNVKCLFIVAMHLVRSSKKVEIVQYDF